MHSPQYFYRNPPFRARLAGDLHGFPPITGTAGTLRSGPRASQARRIGARPTPCDPTQGTDRLLRTSTDLRSNACGRALRKSGPTRPPSGSQQGLGEQGVEGHDEIGQPMMIIWLRDGRGSWRTLIGMTFRLRRQAMAGEIHGSPGRDRASSCYSSRPSLLTSAMKRESERSGSTRGSPFSQITCSFFSSYACSSSSIALSFFPMAQ